MSGSVPPTFSYSYSNEVKIPMTLEEKARRIASLDAAQIDIIALRLADYALNSFSFLTPPNHRTDSLPPSALPTISSYLHSQLKEQLTAAFSEPERFVEKIGRAHV